MSRHFRTVWGLGLTSAALCLQVDSNSMPNEHLGASGHVDSDRFLLTFGRFEVPMRLLCRSERPNRRKETQPRQPRPAERRRFRSQPHEQLRRRSLQQPVRRLAFQERTAWARRRSATRPTPCSRASRIPRARPWVPRMATRLWKALRL